MGSPGSKKQSHGIIFEEKELLPRSSNHSWRAFPPRYVALDDKRLPTLKYRPVLISQGRVASWTSANAVPTMTRRIVRSAVQLLAIALIILFLVVFLDNRYEVLPDAIHDHLPTHHDGLVVTDISAKFCSSFNPLSSCKLDSAEWQHLNKDLYLGKSWSRAYLVVRRKEEKDLVIGDQVVLDVKVGRLDPARENARAHEKWEQRPAGIWILRSAKRHDSDSKHAVTGVDVLFGADAVDPRVGWEIKGSPLHIEASQGALEAHITVRSGSPKLPEKPLLKIRPNGKFKIMQAADLHMSTGVVKCRDPEPKGQSCDADARTLEFASRLLEQERPDLVVLTGDQINGETAPDPQSAILKFADVFIKHKVPYACIFGNHDDLGPLSRSDSMIILENLPYSLSEFGPAAINGVGNYYLEVQAAGNSHHSAVSLYLLDTHSMAPDTSGFSGYNWIRDTQIKWFKSTVKSLKSKHDKYSKLHMDMAFIHIPLPEYHVVDHKNVYGAWREGVAAPRFNSHFKDALVEEGVKLVTAGHDHANEYCALDKAQDGKPQLWMCYGGGAGFGGYGGYGGYIRRMRFFEFDTNGGNVRTWKRVEYGETETKVDYQTVIEAGKAIAV